MQYPAVEELFSVDDQFLIGSALLVKPVTAPGVTQTTVLFPSKDTWYDVDTLEAVVNSFKDDGVVTLTVSSDIEQIPVYQRASTIIPRKLRLRRSSHVMKKDPYTLYVALDSTNKASGKLYMDDEETFGHTKRNEYAVAQFTFEESVLRNAVEVGSGWASSVEELKEGRLVERVIIMGLTNAPTSVSVDGKPLGFEHDAVSKSLVLRKPEVSALDNWEIVFA